MNNRVFKIIKTILNIFVAIFIILFLLVVALQRFSNNKISFLSFRMFTVVSGSMDPKYKIGDVLIAKEIDPSKIKIGDAISYLGKQGTLAGKVVTHEVINIEQDEDGKYIFHTQGIANDAPDPIVYESQVYGKIIYKCIILSFIYTGEILNILLSIFFCVFTNNIIITVLIVGIINDVNIGLLVPSSIFRFKEFISILIVFSNIGIYFFKLYFLCKFINSCSFIFSFNFSSICVLLFIFSILFLFKVILNIGIIFNVYIMILIL